MAVRKPLVLITGVQRELPAADSLSVAWSWVTGRPTTLAGYGITDAVTLNTVQTITAAKTFTTSPVIDNAAGTARRIDIESSGSTRWSFGADGAGETGSDAGTGWVMQRYSDAGALLGNPIYVTRSTGQVTFETAPRVGTDTMWHAGNFTPATKADLASPAFTGTPTAPTPATADNDTSIATTAFVKAQGYTSNTGTVTSVAVANATGISWAGSPITSSGTLTPTLSANLQSWSGIAPASKLDSGTAFEDAFGSSPLYWASNAGLDLDNLEPGQRVLVSTTGNTNVPPAIGGTGFWYVECHRIYSGDAYKRQIATNYNGAGRMYYRFNYNTGWSAWVEVWTQNTATALGIGTSALVYPPNNNFNDAYGMTRFFTGSNTFTNRPADYTANMVMHYSSALSVQLSGTVTGESTLFYRYGGSGGWTGWKTVADLESAQTFTGAKTFQGTTVFDLSTSTSAVARFTQPGSSPAGSTVEITSPNSQPGITGLYAGTHRSDIRFQEGSVVIAPSASTAAPTQGITILSTGVLQVSGPSATIAGNTVWHAGNDGAGSGLDADVLDGAQADQNATASTIAQRTASGDIYARLFRPTYANQTTMSGAIAYRVEAGTDNYIRFCSSPAAVKGWLNIDSRDAPLFPTTANAATTLSATHLNGVIEKSNTTAYTYTIAPSLGAQGDAITIVNSGTAGNITLARGTGVALYQNGVDANITIGPGSMLTIYRSATADRWIA